MAGGVYDYLDEVGMKVGKDISVSGFDNQDIAEYFKPALTTMDLPLEEIGQTAARLLIDRIGEGENDSQTDGKVIEKNMPCSLVVRDSVMRLV